VVPGEGMREVAWERERVGWVRGCPLPSCTPILRNEKVKKQKKKKTRRKHPQSKNGTTSPQTRGKKIPFNKLPQNYTPPPRKT